MIKFISVLSDNFKEKIPVMTNMQKNNIRPKLI